MEKKGKSVVFDMGKCIGCSRCVQTCSKLGVTHLRMDMTRKEKRVLEFDMANPCMGCGQCTLVCPVAAVVEQSNLNEVRQWLKMDDKITIAQCAPSVRSSLNEIFQVDHQVGVEKKLNTCLRQLGFKKIFDVNFGADITSRVEAEELWTRIQQGGVLPMFTSCCPAWVKFLQQWRPDLEKNLTTVLSPHLHAGLAYKTWWAEINGIDPSKLVVISLMPCTTKKEENCEFNGLKAVDAVLTVRELAQLMREKNLNLADAEESEGDVLADYTGGAIIFGKSGGVTESALRVLKKKVDGEELRPLSLEPVTEAGAYFRATSLVVGGHQLTAAIIAEPRNFKIFLQKDLYKKYSYVEVMNCPGGCIGGGGQPLLPANPKVAADLLGKRRELLQTLDTGRQRRNALDNQLVNQYLEWVTTKNLSMQLLERVKF